MYKHNPVPFPFFFFFIIFIFLHSTNDKKLWGEIISVYNVTSFEKAEIRKLKKYSAPLPTTPNNITVIS